MLVAVSSSKGFHVSHPEMVGVGADGVNGLLEREFDFESQAVDPDDIDRVEAEIGGHEDALSSAGMIDEDKAHEGSDRSPEQIERAKVQPHALLCIDGAGRRLHGGGVGEQRAQGHLFSLHSRTPPLAHCGSLGAPIGNGVDPSPSDQMIVLTQ